MSTDRPRIQGYLEPEVHQRFNQFKQEQGLKESPALNQILKEYFGMEDSNQPSASPLAIEEMIDKSLNEKFKEFNLFRAEFKNEVWLQLKTQFNIWNQALQEAIAKEKSTIQELTNRLEKVEATVKPSIGLTEISRPISNSPSKLNLTQLARRLNVAKSVVSSRKSRPDFEAWSRSKDPDGLAWQCRKEGQWLKFYPVEDRE